MEPPRRDVQMAMVSLVRCMACSGGRYEPENAAEDLALVTLSVLFKFHRGEGLVERIWQEMGDNAPPGITLECRMLVDLVEVVDVNIDYANLARHAANYTLAILRVRLDINEWLEAFERLCELHRVAKHSMRKASALCGWTEENDAENFKVLGAFRDNAKRRPYSLT